MPRLLNLKDFITPNGTGDAVSTAIKLGEIKTDFIVVYGDLVVGNSLINILENYRDQNELRSFGKDQIFEIFAVEQVMQTLLSSMERPSA